MTDSESSIFKGATLMITGGTGSFGNAVLSRFLDSDLKEVRIFSRICCEASFLKYFHEQ